MALGISRLLMPELLLIWGDSPPTVLISPESYDFSPRLISSPAVGNLSTMTVVDPRVSDSLWFDSGAIPIG